MKYFRLPYILFRDYPDFGYLTDNRNFGYDTASKSCLKVGDTILSKVGSMFYSVLEDKPLSVTSLSKKLLPMFKDVTASELEKDAAEFYGMLADDGFVGQDEISTVASYFSYSDKVAKALPLAEDGQEKANDVYKKWAHVIICLEFIWRFHVHVMNAVFTVIFPIHIGKVQCHETYSSEFLRSA